MPYYPSSQVKTNLYTNGDEFTTSDGAPYVGYYFTNSQGLSYTGKTPQAPITDRLYLNNSSPNENPVFIAKKQQQASPDGNYSFFNIDYPYYAAQRRSYNQAENAPLKPIQEICIPTPNDYEIGEFQRYFVKKNNETQYIEVQYSQYDLFATQNAKVQWQLYTPITITWVLEGKLEDVYNINKNIVRLSEKRNKCYGFVSYFNNRFTKFHKEETPSANIEAASQRISGNY
tara:strand:- start:1564 stop:2253 length:690 start_codon:yes stop_codon:yes gene_type:complete